VNIAVLVKASIDLNMLRIDSSGRLLLDETPLAISEYDRNAVEEAVRIKEAKGGKVVALSVLTWGPAARKAGEAENVLREALAMGADEAHLVVDESIIPGSVDTTAEVLKAMVEKLGPFDLVLCGESSQDVLSSQMAARLGEKLGYTVVTFARKLEVLDGKIRATRDLEDALEVVEAELPAVVSVTGEINEPRLPTLLQIRRSFAKPLKRYTLADLGLEGLKAKLPAREISLVTVSRKNIILEAESLEEVADQLIAKLMEEGVIR